MADTHTATILVTDLVGSTELRVRLGEEQAEHLRREHDDLVRGAIEASGGTCVKNLGDGVLALFESASDAVSAAVAVQQASDLHTRSHPDRPLELRVGLSAGDVTLEDGDCFGTPVVEASRLCGVATGGQILAAELVRMLARGRGGHTFVAAGERELKGLPEPVPVAVVGWEPAQRPEAALPFPAQLQIDPGQLPFAGRDSQFDSLVQTFKETAAGDRRVALLAGEPGIGKTRLASEVARRAHEAGAAVLVGRCDEGLGVPYQPFVEALSQMAAAQPSVERLGRHAGELVRLVPELSLAVPGLEPPLRADPETERYRLFDAVAAWLAALGSPDGVVLVLDDLHWAERETLLLLRHLIRSPEAQRLFIIGTYRDTDLSRTHPLAEMLADFRREPVVERVSLSGLDVSGITELLETAAGGRLDIRAGELAQALWAETEGNPFFVVEIVRNLVESGVLVQRDGVWTADVEVVDLPIPEGVREVVGRRLSRLSDTANQVLGTAAVIGQDFDVDLLVTVAGVSEDAVLDALDEATAAALVREPQPDTYQFTHALVRSTLYDELSATRRGRRHRQVADALEARGATDPGALAYHYGRSGTGDLRGIDYGVAAGEQALAQLAPAQARNQFALALELVDELDADEERRARVLVGLGTAQRHLGDARYRDTLLEAGRVARRAGASDLLAAAAMANNRGTWSAVGTTDGDKIELLQAALDAVGPEDSATRARLLGLLALEHYWVPGPARFDLSAEAVEVARRVGDPAALADALSGRSLAAIDPHNTAERRVLFPELVDLCRQLGDPLRLGTALAWQCVRVLEDGDLDSFDPVLEELGRIADDIGSPLLRWYHAVYVCTRAQVTGTGAEIEQLALRALEIGQEAGEPDVMNWFAPQYATALDRQGREAELIPLAQAEDERIDVPTWRLALAHFLASLGRLDEARPYYQPFVEQRFENLPRDLVWTTGMAWAADTARRLGDVEGAGIIHELLLPLRGRLPDCGVVVFPVLDHYLGLVAAALGDGPGAEAHFDAADALHQRLGARGWMAMTQLERGRLRLEQGDPTARAVLEAARSAGEAAGYQRVVRDAEALLAG